MGVASAANRWTLRELHRLPDDGNKYELVHGELFVTPPPGNVHESVHARLNRILVPYVDEQRLGFVFAVTPAVRRGGSEVLPDLIVRAPAPGINNDWENAPTPILIVEILSPTTRRRDLDQKRRYYLEDVGVPEYWVVDPDAQTVRVVRPGTADLVTGDTFAWAPHGANAPLELSVPSLFEGGGS